MGDTNIEWADKVWNPVTGCSKVSAGCTNCYAEKTSHRFGFTNKPWNAAYAAENVKTHPERLDQPIHWRKPQKIFVNSMSDLFHEQVPFEFIDRVFAVMAQAQQHTFQILTKRPKRMLEYLTSDQDIMTSRIGAIQNQIDFRYAAMCPPEHFGKSGRIVVAKIWPLPNVWLGVSVENQQAADERIPPLLKTPSAMRFLSCEPLLGEVDLTFYSQGEYPEDDGYAIPAIQGIDWVIAGGESGPNARPMHPDWARSLRDQCVASGVSYFFKQWGEWVPYGIGAWTPRSGNYRILLAHDTQFLRVGKKNAGRMLDGRTWDEMPKGVSELD